MCDLMTIKKWFDHYRASQLVPTTPRVKSKGMSMGQYRTSRLARASERRDALLKFLHSISENNVVIATRSKIAKMAGMEKEAVTVDIRALRDAGLLSYSVTKGNQESRIVLKASA